MRDLRDYVKVNEELNDNSLWMLGKWFELWPDDQSEYLGLVTKCMTDHITQPQKIYDLALELGFSQRIKQMLMFVYNEVEHEGDMDIPGMLKKLIDVSINVQRQMKEDYDDTNVMLHAEH